MMTLSNKYTQLDDNNGTKGVPSSCTFDIVLSRGLQAGGRQGGYPMPLLFASSVATEHGLNVKIIDYFDDIADLTRIVKQYETSLWGLTCPVNLRFETFTAAEVIKRLRPETLVVLGGVFASQCYEQIMEDLPFIDVVVRGEGEYALYELFLAAQGKMKFEDVLGISWRDTNGKVIHNSPRPMIKDINELPNLNYELLSLSNEYGENIASRYFSKKLQQDVYGGKTVKVAELMFSRGCPFDCIFCSSKKHHFGRFRIFRPERAVQQIEWFYERGYRLFVFWDDHLLLNRKWFNAFCELILQKGLTFYCKMSARVDSVTEEIAQKLNAIGCTTICLGLEYGDDRVLKEIHKDITTAETEHALKVLCKYDIKPYAGMIINFPCETEESIENSVSFFKRLEQWWPSQHLAPRPVEVYPGTVMESEYWLKRYPRFRWTKPYFNKYNVIYRASPSIPIWQNWHWTKEFYLLLKAALKVGKRDLLESLLDKLFFHIDTKYLTRKDRFVIKTFGTLILVFILIRTPRYFTQLRIVFKNKRPKKGVSKMFKRFRRKLTNVLDTLFGKGEGRRTSSR